MGDDWETDEREASTDAHERLISGKMITYPGP